MAPVINCIVVVSQNMGIGKNGDLPWPMNEPGHQRLFVTRILREFESDMFFPETDLKRYKLLPEYPGVLTDVQEEKGIQHKCEVHEKHG